MFLGDLIERTFGETAMIAPRRASRFEPSAGPVEPVTMEAVEDRPSPRLAPFPSPATATPGEQPAGRIETHVLASPLARPVPPPDTPRIFTVEKTVAPMVSSAAAPLQFVSERPAERRETQPAVIPYANRPMNPITRETLRETSKETVIREMAETRVESRTIERRLESLVREREIDRIGRNGVQAPQNVPKPAPETRATPAVTPRRTVLIPETKQMGAPEPSPMEAALPVESTVVQVTIGRVEIRASAPASARQMPRSREPKLGLEDYLRRRERA